MKHLILGGARSGKSRYAEQQAQSLSETSQRQVVYIATATAGDGEMAARIEAHQQRRPRVWQLIEAPVQLADVVMQFSSPHDCLLIDCLSLWLSNCLHQQQWALQRDNFIKALAQTQATVFLVSNEVGSGIVPMGELSRQFVDESGRLHQQLAACCDRVSLVVAGLPLALKHE
ncbi:MAG: bifunctional adenosylcobinamide kinase/adenosylcobinamide-phosphate guanylyltransferase [Cellvibrionaceae bacterium]|nr:bifunctional adenosylcobinamide kinase/adenosylcobinamide-phosphate guanylyltransferase [Cellvibrionaceae bacterium]